MIECLVLRYKISSFRVLCLGLLWVTRICHCWLGLEFRVWGLGLLAGLWLFVARIFLLMATVTHSIPIKALRTDGLAHGSAAPHPQLLELLDRLCGIGLGFRTLTEFTLELAVQ